MGEGRTRLWCNECSTEMEITGSMWMSGPLGIGNYLVPCFNCINKKCKEGKKYLKRKKQEKKDG